MTWTFRRSMAKGRSPQSLQTPAECPEVPKASRARLESSLAVARSGKLRAINYHRRMKWGEYLLGGVEGSVFFQENLSFW